MRTGKWLILLMVALTGAGGSWAADKQPKAPVVQGTMRRSSLIHWDKFYVAQVGEQMAKIPDDSSAKFPLIAGKQKVVFAYFGRQPKTGDYMRAGPVEAEIEAGKSSFHVDGLKEGNRITFLVREDATGAEVFRSNPQEMFLMVGDAHFTAGGIINTYMKKRIDGRFEVYADGPPGMDDDILKKYWGETAEKFAAGRRLTGEPSVAPYEYIKGYSPITPYDMGTKKTGKRAYGIVTVEDVR